MLHEVQIDSEKVMTYEIWEYALFDDDQTKHYTR